MIRKRKEIDLDIKGKKEYLEIAIDDSVKAEKRSDEYISSIKDRLSELSSEICFEDTLKGKVDIFEQEAFRRIELILKKLSERTGRSYEYTEKQLRGRLR